MSASVAESGGGMGESAALELARLQARTSLASLPEPKNQVSVQTPQLSEEEENLAQDESVSQDDCFAPSALAASLRLAVVCRWGCCESFCCGGRCVAGLGHGGSRATQSPARRRGFSSALSFADASSAVATSKTPAASAKGTFKQSGRIGGGGRCD